MHARTHAHTHAPLHQVPHVVTCGLGTMAVRLPAHPVARALIALAGCPLAAPSANSSGRPSPTRAHHVVEDLGARPGLGLVVDGGACAWGVESTVRMGWGRGGAGGGAQGSVLGRGCGVCMGRGHVVRVGLASHFQPVQLPPCPARCSVHSVAGRPTARASR